MGKRADRIVVDSIAIYVDEGSIGSAFYQITDTVVVAVQIASVVNSVAIGVGQVDRKERKAFVLQSPGANGRIRTVVNCDGTSDR